VVGGIEQSIVLERIFPVGFRLVKYLQKKFEKFQAFKPAAQIKQPLIFRCKPRPAPENNLPFGLS